MDFKPQPASSRSSGGFLHKGLRCELAPRSSRGKAQLGLHRLPRGDGGPSRPLPTDGKMIHSKGLLRTSASCAVNFEKDLTHQVGQPPLPDRHLNGRVVSTAGLRKHRRRMPIYSRTATIAEPPLERTGGDHGGIAKAPLARAGLTRLLMTTDQL